MKYNSLLPALIVAAVLFSGCISDPTVEVRVFVHDAQGNPISNVYVSAYSNYSISSGAGSELSGIDGSLEASVQTGEDGIATFNILPGNYAFRASSPDGSVG
ncbi:MAG TPA: hypothetical protein VFF09_04935, partial [archaeon]|nr:hypothetical protein [archaeon]